MDNHSAGLGQFFARAAQLPLLTATEEITLGRATQAGDKAARNKLVEHNIRLAVHIAKRYRNKGLSFEDLVSEGVMGLHRAADKFDPEKGFRFSTYATWWITHFLQRAVQNTGNTIRTPGHILARRNKLLKYLDEHPDATMDELARHAECRADQVEEALDQTRVVASLDTMLDDPTATAYDIIADPNSPQPGDDVITHNARLREAMGHLTELERRVIELRFGFDGPVRGRDDVADELGVKPYVVQRAQRTAILKLKSALGTIPDDGGVVDLRDRRGGGTSFTHRTDIDHAPVCVRSKPV